MNQLLSEVRDRFIDEIDTQGLPASYLSSIEHHFLPLAAQLVRVKAAKNTNSPLLVGVYGSQGSGKTTMASFLRDLLMTQFGEMCVVMSLDDFYFTRKERQVLAQEIHPLLTTRGVPGTHDLDLLNKVLDELCEVSSTDSVSVPCFSKAIDDRTRRKDWRKVTEKPSIVILEGWCVGVPPQPEHELEFPVNELEHNEDPDMVWRTYVNKSLQTGYAELFGRFDELIALLAPSFDCVLDWRLLQEKKLKARYDKSQNTQLKIMSRDEIIDFIQHYQRITQHALQTMPKLADYALELGHNHQITRMTVRARHGS